MSATGAFGPRKRSVRLSWMVSYALLLLVPILVFSPLFWTTVRSMDEQLAELNAALVEVMGREIDGKLEYVKRLINDIAWNPICQSLMYKTDLDDPGDNFDMFRLSEQLADYASYSRFTDLFFVHFANLDGVLMPKSYSTLEQFHANYLAGTAWGIEGFRTLLGNWQDGASVVFQYYVHSPTQVRNAVAVLKSLPPSSSSPVVATIVVVVDSATITAALRTAVKATGAQIRILNRQGQVIASTMGGEVDGSIPATVAETATLVRDSLSVDGTIYTLMQRRSEHFGWTVQLLVPENIIRGRLVVVQLLFALGILGSVLLGALLTVFLLRRNYGPLYRLMNNLPGGEGADRGSGDEFSYISQAFAKTQEEKQLAQDRFERNKDTLRANLVGRMLRGEMAIGIELDDSLAALGMQLPSALFTVVAALHLDLPANLPGSQADCHPGLARHLIHQVLTEQFAGVGRVYASADGDPFFYLLNFLVDMDLDAAVIADRIAAAGADLEKRFGIQLLSAFSAAVVGVASLPQARQQAATALEYRYVAGGNRPLSWDELRMESAGETYVFDSATEGKLVSLLQAGDQDGVRAVLADLFARALAPGAGQAQHGVLRCLVWDLGACLIKALSAIADRDNGYLTLLEPLSSIADDASGETARRELPAIFATACRWAAARQRERREDLKSRANQEFIGEVTNWLRGNFRDPALSLTRAAEVHGLSAAYLSRLFRENQEDGILDVLNHRREEHAKSRLRTGDGSVQEIGVASGFTDVKTFIRTFKKVTGITPGKFRETVSK